MRLKVGAEPQRALETLYVHCCSEGTKCNLDKWEMEEVVLLLRKG